MQKAVKFKNATTAATAAAASATTAAASATSYAAASASQAAASAAVNATTAAASATTYAAASATQAAASAAATSAAIARDISFMNLRRTGSFSLSRSFFLGYSSLNAKQLFNVFSWACYPGQIVGALTIILTIATFAAMMIQAALEECSHSTWQVGMPLASPQPLLVGPISAVLVSYSHGHGRWISLYMFLCWIGVEAQSLEVYFSCDKPATTAKFLRVFKIFVFVFSQWVYVLLVSYRMKVLEKAMCESLGVWVLRRIQWSFILPGTIGFVLVLLLGQGEPEDFVTRDRIPIGVTFWAAAVVVVSYVAAVCMVLRRASRFVWDILKLSNSKAWLTIEALQAIWAVRAQLLGVLMKTITAGVVAVCYALYNGYAWPVPFLEDLVPETLGKQYQRDLFIYIPSLLDTLSNSIGCLLFAGVFSGGIQAGAENRRQRMIARKKRRVRLMVTIGRQVGATSEWHQKVVELAHRGISLEALLEFYAGLGTEYMPEFDPSVHTTSDVARQAIIPQSADDTTAMSIVMMKPHVSTGMVRPQKMVTHAWSNLFHDLVAAIIADVLDEHCYKNVSFLLRESLPTLRRWVEKVGGLQRTYWVCVFAVNQHASICHDNAGCSVDPVSQFPIPVCSCGMRKWGNTSEPTFNGRSVHCEMNKFDDMMRYLAGTDRKFQQVIAVDQAFKIFSRAWCMAEVVEADQSGMMSSMKLFSVGKLITEAQWLQDIRVQDMQAWRPEDVEEILNKIPDKEQFNFKIRMLIFDRLVADVRFLNAADQMRHVGQIARWEHVMQAQRIRPSRGGTVEISSDVRKIQATITTSSKMTRGSNFSRTSITTYMSGFFRLTTGHSLDADVHETGLTQESYDDQSDEATASDKLEGRTHQSCQDDFEIPIITETPETLRLACEAYFPSHGWSL